MKKILIIGGSGFIGRHLIGAMSREHQVYSVSRTAMIHPKVMSISADLSKPSFTQVFPECIDCVIYLAQSSQYRNFPGGAEDMRRVNIDALIETLEWARVSGVEQFIYASSANVYEQTGGVLSESSPAVPSSFYGVSKLCGEFLTYSYKDFFSVIVLRIFTVYGPGQTQMLIPKIVSRITSGGLITLAQGKGLLFTPVFVGDVVKVTENMITRHKKNEYVIFNLCGDEQWSLVDAVTIIERILNKRARLQGTNTEPQSFCGSNLNLKKAIGNFNFTTLERGLSITLNPSRSIFRGVLCE